MAERISNPYHELFESLTIPERLEPENIAAMLDERFAQSKISSEKKSPEIKISETEKRVPAEKTEREYPREITVSGKHRVSAVYRSLASLAACAAMVFGVLAYMGYADIPAADSSEPHDGGAFASDYDDVHKTFEKYYVNSPDSKTLDSAIADIEHSYADNENNSSQNSVDTPDDTSADPTVEPDAPVGDSTVPTPAEPVPDEPPAATEPETPAETPVEKPSGLPIPEKGASADNSDILFGDGFILRRDENIIRVISNSSGSISYT